MYIYHIFIHSSTDEHLDCFCVLAVVNNAMMNIGMHVSFQITLCFSFEKYPEVGLLDCIVILFLGSFEEPPYCFP